MAPPRGSILITGANGGLGSATVAHVLQAPGLASKYTGLYAVRKAATASRLRAVLKAAPAAHRHEILELDLGSLRSVEAVAAETNRRVASGELPPIRALILGAAYMEFDTLTTSDDGFEMTWQVNFLANLVLSLMLLQSMDKDEGRLLIVSSWSHEREERHRGPWCVQGSAVAGPVPGPEALAKSTWNTPQMDRSGHSGFRRYGASKLCAVMLMHELGRRLAEDPELSKISVLGLNPGAMGSDIGRRGPFRISTVIMKIVIPLLAPLAVRLSPNGTIRPLWKSAADVVSACFETPPPRGQALYLNGTEAFETAADARDEEKRRALWEYGLRAAGLEGGDTVLVDWQ